LTNEMDDQPIRDIKRAISTSRQAPSSKLWDDFVGLCKDYIMSEVTRDAAPTPYNAMPTASGREGTLNRP